MDARSQTGVNSSQTTSNLSTFSAPGPHSPPVGQNGEELFIWSRNSPDPTDPLDSADQLVFNDDDYVVTVDATERVESTIDRIIRLKAIESKSKYISLSF